MAKKKSPTTEIIRAITGNSVDPLLEKAATLLIKRYQKNRARGLGPLEALTATTGEMLSVVQSRRPRPLYSNVPPHVRRNPAKRKEESEDAIIARLKRELDARIARDTKP